MNVKERYLARRKEIAEKIEQMKETDPQMAESARRILFPDVKNKEWPYARRSTSER